MKVTWKDGAAFEGDTSDAVVERMLKHSPFTSTLSTPLYMRAVAMRALLYRGAQVRSEDAVEFLLDLEQAGYITEVQA